MRDPKFVTRLRVVVKAALVFGCVSCGDATAPPTLYTLTTVNGIFLPVPFFRDAVTPIRSGSLALGPGQRAVEIINVGCENPLPPGTTCTPVSLRLEGTYSLAAKSITLNGGTSPAAFLDNRVTIVTGDGITAGTTDIWVFERP